jgi:hypothetical protein
VAAEGGGVAVGMAMGAEELMLITIL